MKNLIAILITIILSILGLAGCDNNVDVKPTYVETVISTYDEVTESAYEQETSSVYVTSEAAEVSSTNATTPATTNTKTESDTKVDAEDKEVTVGNGGPSVDREPEEENVISQGNATQGHTHSYAAATFKATCTKDGYSLYSCHCGASYESDYVDALGHKWGSWETVKEATTESEGKKQRTCDRCGKVESKAVDKLERSIEDRIKNIEELTLYYINQYRNVEATALPKMTLYAEMRAEQLHYNFAHDTSDIRSIAEQLQYGEYIDPSSWGATGREPYWQAPCSEAIIGATRNRDDLGLAILFADTVYNSSGHWRYVGLDSNIYLSIGVAYNDGYWTCCIATGNADAVNFE